MSQIDYDNFNGYLNWFDQNEADIQKFGTNLPEMVDNLDERDESFYSQHMNNFNIPPFPPLFDFKHDGKFLENSVY